MKKSFVMLTALLVALPVFAQSGAPRTAAPLAADIDARASAIEKDLIAWRRYLHQNPELSNREVGTAKYVAEQLRSFGLEPTGGVGRHGVVAVLRGGQPGPVVALRADMTAFQWSRIPDCRSRARRRENTRADPLA